MSFATGFFLPPVIAYISRLSLSLSMADIRAPRYRFMARRKLTEKGHIYLAAHQTAVELCMMQALNKPLTAVCQVLEHDKSVFKMMWKCKIQLGEDKGKLDTALVFPNKDAKDALFYVFQQIGNPPEPEATAEESSAAEEATEQTEFDEEELEEEEIVPESVTKPSNPLPFFGYRDTRDDGFLSISLNDPATKFAVCPSLSSPMVSISYDDGDMANLDLYIVPQETLPVDGPLLPRSCHPLDQDRQAGG